MQVSELHSEVLPEYFRLPIISSSLVHSNPPLIHLMETNDSLLFVFNDQQNTGPVN